MDLFSLVAKLTLDDSDYTSKLGAAESAGSGANLDASGELSVTDNYSGDLDKADKAVGAFDEKSATADINVDTTKATENTTSFESFFKGSVERMGVALTAAGIAAGVKKIAEEFQKALNSTAAYADEVDKQSAALSMNTQAYQEWRYVLQQNGASISDIKKGWQSLTAVIANNGDLSDASADIIDVFDALKIDPKEYKSTEALFNAVIKGFAMMEDGAERDNLVKNLFGPNGTQLNALLNSGAKGIDELTKRAHELGLIMSDTDITNAVNYGDAIADMNSAVEALKQNIVSGLFPLLTDAANMIAGVVAFFNGRTDADTLVSQFEQIDQQMNKAFFQIGEDEAVTTSLIAELKAMSDETGKCKDNLNKWKATAEKLITLCPGLKSQIDLVTGSFTEQTGSLEENAQAWFKNARTQAAQQAVQDKTNALAQQAAKIAELEVEVIALRAEEEFKRSEAIRMIHDKVQASGNKDLMEKYSLEKLNEMPSYLIQSNLEGDLYDLFGGRFNSEWQLLHNDYLNATGRSAEIGNLLIELTALKDDYAEAEGKYKEYIDAVEKYINGLEQEGTGEETGTDMSGTEESADAAAEAVDGVADALEELPEEKTVTINVQTNTTGFGEPDISPFMDAVLGGKTPAEYMAEAAGAQPHASGLWSVPYDNYLAELHRGERVLTASQARQNGGFETSEIVEAIRSLRMDMTNLQIVVGKQTFGRTVVRYGGKRLGGYLGGEEDRTAAGYGWG